MEDFDINDFEAISQMVPRINVRLTRRNARTGRVIDEILKKNRVTKLALMGMVRLINGEFNNTTPLRIEDYIPRYLALGTNKAGVLNPGVTTEVTVNDSQLLDELIGSNNLPRRILLTQKNILENRLTNPFVKLTIKCFIPVDQFIGEIIGEAGLFAHDSGNNCWARIAFEPFVKSSNEVIDVTWEITIMSVGNTVYPESMVVNPDTWTMKVGEAKLFKVVITPDTSTTKTVTWESSNTSIATVDSSSGTAIGVKSGTCTIIATTTNGIKASATLNITN